MKDRVYSLFPACYLLSALLQMHKRDPVPHKAAEAPPRWKPLLSEAAQHIWNVSSADLLTKPLLPLEGLEDNAATPGKYAVWRIATKRL